MSLRADPDKHQRLQAALRDVVRLELSGLMTDAGSSAHVHKLGCQAFPYWSGTCGGSELIMMVKDGMSQVVLSVGPAHTLREAARMMAIQRVGAAVVHDPDRSGIGILTERDILNSMGADQDPDAELVSEHRTTDVVFASPEWTLERAAETMVAGEFRHLIVVDGGEVTGLLSMRDIVRCWSASGTPLEAEACAEREAFRAGARAN